MNVFVGIGFAALAVVVYFLLTGIAAYLIVKNIMSKKRRDREIIVHQKAKED